VIASEVIRPSRRGFLGSLIVLIATPAIVRAASLMPVKMMPAKEVLDELFVDEIYPVTQNNLLTVQMITKEAVRLWKNSNLFLQNINLEDHIGSEIRIRLPQSRDTALAVLSPV